MAFQFKPDAVLFIAESFKRWGQKSPKYFRIWKTVNWALTSIGGTGITLIQLTTFSHGIWPKIIFSVIGFCGAYGVAMNTLPVSKPADLPFTEKKQVQQIEKELNKPQ